MVVSDTSGFVLIRELDLYSGLTDDFGVKASLPFSVSTPPHILKHLNGEVALSKAEVHAIALRDSQVYKLVSHKGFIYGLEKWTL